ncbi:MAG: hypothetical protein II060_12230, partial [Bacteroidales bacterium]|nr:hypothetical protein [Bacteroidales bacterium]
MKRIALLLICIALSLVMFANDGSLFMAVTRAVFRTVSAHESMPDCIVTTMNKTIADMNRNHM